MEERNPKRGTRSSTDFASLPKHYSDGREGTCRLQTSHTPKEAFVAELENGAQQMEKEIQNLEQNESEWDSLQTNFEKEMVTVALELDNALMGDSATQDVTDKESLYTDSIMLASLTSNEFPSSSK